MRQVWFSVDVIITTGQFKYHHHTYNNSLDIVLIIAHEYLLHICVTIVDILWVSYGCLPPMSGAAGNLFACGSSSSDSPRSRWATCKLLLSSCTMWVGMKERAAVFVHCRPLVSCSQKERVCHTAHRRVVPINMSSGVSLALCPGLVRWDHAWVQGYGEW